MLQLTRVVYEDVGDRVGGVPSESSDGAAYIKQCVELERGVRG